MIRPKTLQQRLLFFLLLPVAVLLFGVGALGFVHMRHILLEHWREATVLRLEKIAHQVDMRLARPKELVSLYFRASASPDGRTIQEWVIQQLKRMEGVEDVRVTWLEETASDTAGPFCQPASLSANHVHGEQESDQAATLCQLEVTAPRYDADIECQTVVLSSEGKTRRGEPMGKIEVFLRFDYLIESIASSRGSEVFKVALVDDCGEVFFSSTEDSAQPTFESKSLEAATLEATRTQNHGTILGEGRPPHEVSGFYKLHEAPWTIVVVAPGRVILGELIQFRDRYFVWDGGLIVLIIFLIRSIVGRTVSTIQNVSEAADRIAQGDLDSLVPSTNGGQDELSKLIHSFNRMVLQLQERIRLKEAVGLAQEMQQSLLPRCNPAMSGLDIAGKSDYCDETGGDYFDFIYPEGTGEHPILVAIGDVVGHGFGAALLMTTVRAFLRSRLAMPGNLTQVVTDVNKLLCRDTDQTDSFMTLFLARIDSSQGTVRWVRAGHDPAMLYTPQTDTFIDLQGGGAALGIDSNFTFQEYTHGNLAQGEVLLIGTDGIWEAEDASGGTFGKARLREIIRQHHQLPASDLVQMVLSRVDQFRDGAPQADDATLVVVKVGSESPDNACRDSLPMG
jgi:phosphoserine phosphatase RsbU/P